MDDQLFHLLNDIASNSFLDKVMPVVSNKLVWIPLYVLMVLIAILKFKKQSWKPVLVILITFLATELISNGLKHSFKKKRPNQIESVYAIKRVAGGSGYSLPSAHAANHMALAVIFGLVLGLKWGWKLLLYVWAIVIGFSRIYNGVHFPSDVIIGFGIGGLTALGIYTLYQLLAKRFPKVGVSDEQKQLI